MIREVSNAFFLAGPTAVGKTDLAIALAEACNGEIVGMDAFQIYAGLPILTTKPSAAQLARVPHHLIGSVPRSEPYSVARYLDEVQPVLANICARGRLPIITGGTGLYFRALTRGLSEAPPANTELREKLSQTPLPELVENLRSLDPEAAATVDLANPRRVVRALEVVILSGKPFSSFRQEWQQSLPFHGVFLYREREELHQRIQHRTEQMFEQGVVEEVAEAMKTPMGETARQVLGWEPIVHYLEGTLGKAACIEAIVQATRQYAKRQMTWFRKEPGLTPLSLTDHPSPLKALVEAARHVARV